MQLLLLFLVFVATDVRSLSDGDARASPPMFDVAYGGVRMSPQAAEEQIQYLPLDRVYRDPNQPRREFDEEALAGLAASFREVGQLFPIRVRLVGDRFVILDGERRWIAAKRALFSTIAAIVEAKDLCDVEVVHRQLIANCQREDLNPLETATAIDRLMQETGWNATTIAGHLGFSISKVTRLLDALELPETIRPCVQSGTIGMSAASELAKIDDPALQAQLAAQVAAGELTRDELAEAVRAYKSSNGQSQPESLAAPVKSSDELGAVNGNTGGEEAPRRATKKLDDGRSVTVSGVTGLDLSAFIETLDKVVRKARAARDKGVDLSTFIKQPKVNANAKSKA
jgi:ParB family chromosome partitioning protein